MRIHLCKAWQLYNYCKIPKISPGAYIFQRTFLRGLFLEGLIYGGKFAFQNQLGQPLVGRKFTIFALFYFAFEGNFQVQAPGGLYSEGRFNGGFFALRFWGAYIWRGLYMEGLIFGILWYFKIIRLGGSEICLPDVNMHYNQCYQLQKNVFPGIQYNRFVLLVITGLHCQVWSRKCQAGTAGTK